MALEIINNNKRTVQDGKANSKSGSKASVHTVKAEDLRIAKPIPGEGGLSMVLKLR